MGKGKYAGTIAESIMFSATKKYELNIEVKPHFDRDSKTIIPYSWNGSEFEQQVSHFNIDIIVSDIIKQLTDAKLEGLRYKYVSHNPLRNDAFSVFWEKFEHCNWTIGETWYYPAHDEYTLDITLQGKKFDYLHKGSLSVGHSRKIGMFFMENYPEYII